MDQCQPSRFFLELEQTFQRQYEALRAVFVEAEPIEQVAARFGYKISAFTSIVSRFRADCRRGVTPPFFSPTNVDVPPGPEPTRPAQAPNRPKSPTAES
jgi:hypothetical protein